VTGSAPPRSGGTALVEQLVREGVEVVFGLPGVQLMAILDSFHGGADEIRFVTTRHEQATTFMADGYARVTRRPGTTLIVPGPGVYNAATGLATAYAASSPVLQLSGQVNRAGIGAGHSLPHEVHDQLDVVRPITKRAERVADPDHLPRAVHDAFVAMRSGRPRPTHLEVPPETLAEPTTAPVLERAPEQRAEADPDLVAAATDLLAGAERPLVIAGGGVHVADAAAHLTELAEHLQAGVVTTREGKGALDERSPLSLGTVFVHRRLDPAIQAADVVLAVGTRLQGFTFSPTARVTHLDADASEIGRFAAPAVALVADARAGLAQLLDAVRSRCDRAPDRAAELRAIRADVDAQLDAIEPQAGLVRALRDALPSEAVVVVDACMVGYMAHLRFPVHGPRSWLTSSYMGTLGFASNMAMGAKVGAPDRPVVSLNGDGGFLFASNELATAVQHGIATINVVFNDGAYGNTHLDQRAHYGGRILGTELRNPDLVAYAESFGAVGVRVATADGLAGAVRGALTETIRPVVIEVPTPRLESAF
jgi:acetolactate synthase-1/2/3 large subunit